MHVEITDEQNTIAYAKYLAKTEAITLNGRSGVVK